LFIVCKEQRVFVKLRSPEVARRSTRAFARCTARSAYFGAKSCSDLPQHQSFRSVHGKKDLLRDNFPFYLSPAGDAKERLILQ
jgi:hypothetical protein